MIPNKTTIFWVVYGFAAVFVWATTYFLGQEPITTNIFLFCFAQFFVLYVVALGLMPRLDRKDGMATLSRPIALSVFWIGAVANIFCFAVFHFKLSLVDTTGGGVPSVSKPEFSDALYFSTVTFTTLGYGDFQPRPETRLAAASQALMGYIYLGLGLGLVIHAYRPAKA